MLDVKNLRVQFLESPHKWAVDGVSFHMDDGEHLSRVVYQLDAYCKVMTYCQKSLKIEIQFDQIGEIEEIKNPIL